MKIIYIQYVWVVAIPIDFVVEKLRLKWKSPIEHTTAEISPILERYPTVSVRKADVALAQAYVGYTTKVHPVAT